jgi:hypothetical protein
MMGAHKEKEPDVSYQESERRCDEALKRALNTPTTSILVDSLNLRESCAKVGNAWLSAGKLSAPVTGASPP